MFQFPANQVVVPSGIGPVKAGDINEVRENPGALNMAEKVMAKPHALVRPINEARDIRYDESPEIAQFHDPQVGLGGCEGIVGDLGPCRGDARNERAFTGIGQTDKTDIGDEFQFESEMARLAGFSGFGETGRLIGRGGELAIPLAAATSPGHADGLVGLIQVFDGEIQIDVLDNGSGGDMDGEVLAGFSELLFAHTRLTAFCIPMASRREIEERVELIVGDDKDAAAVAAVAAVGAAFRDESLTPKAHTALAAATCLDEYFRSIDEHNRLFYHKVSMICNPSVKCLGVHLNEKERAAILCHSL